MFFALDSVASPHHTLPDPTILRARQPIKAKEGNDPGRLTAPAL